MTRFALAPPAVPVLAAGGFDWSSALISAAALAGLLIVSIAVVSAIRENKRRKS
jgi:hypothetical protein